MNEPGFRFRSGIDGRAVQRWDVALDGVAYGRHRHEHYAIGVTRAGVQRFFYRGDHWAGLPGQWHVLHPDEIHDGMPGAPGPMRYRIFHVDPYLIQAASPTGTLPFVARPVVPADRIPVSAVDLLARLSEPLDELVEIELIADLATVLADLADAPSVRPPVADPATVRRVAEALRDDPLRAHTGVELEALSGLSRWSLARQFRAVAGLSPSRYRLAARVRRAQALIAAGTGLADAAARSGFSDQAHLTRAFRSVVGLTPGRWRTGLDAAAS